MENSIKVSVNKKTRQKSTIKISLVGTVTLSGFILSIYSLFTANFLFSAWYFVAFILGLSYVVIRINAVFPSYIAIDGDKLIISVWKNGILPYRIPEKPNFVSDFMPEKLKKDEVLLSEISEVYVGSKRFLNRNARDEIYPDILRELDSNRHFEAVIKKMDFLLVVTKDGESCFMSVTDFEIKGLSSLLDEIERSCAGVRIFVGIPKLKRIREGSKKA